MAVEKQHRKKLNISINTLLFVVLAVVDLGAPP